MSEERSGWWQRLMTPTHTRDADQERWMIGGPRSRWIHLVLTISFMTILLLVVLLWRPDDFSQRWFWVVLALFWIAHAVYSWFQASTGTTLTHDRIVVRDHQHVTDVPWSDIVRIRPDLESRWASHLIVERRDGSQVPLAIVPLDALDTVMTWAPPSVER